MTISLEFSLCHSLSVFVPLSHRRPPLFSLFLLFPGLCMQTFSSSSIILSGSIHLFVSELTLFIIHATVDVAAVLFPSQREERAKTAYIFSFSVKELQNEPLTLWLVSQPCLPL